MAWIAQGGAVKVLADAENPSDIAVDDTHVYSSDAKTGTLFKRAR